jgi:hypothetical protein
MQLAGRAVGAIVAALGKRRPKSSQAVEADEPAILTSPRFSEAARRDEQSSVRAA